MKITCTSILRKLPVLRIYRKKKYLCRKWIPITLATLITLILILYFREYAFKRASSLKVLDVWERFGADYKATNELVQKQLEEILKTENRTGCVMPQLDLYSEQALEYNKDIIPTITCTGVDWVSCYKTKCSVKQEILNQYKNIECIYKDIIYVRDDYYYIGEPSKVLGGDDYILTKSDIVKVSCTGIDVNGFGLLKSHWSGNKVGFRDIETTKINEDSLNVLVLFFDSASRNGFLRRMPKSYRTITDQLQAVVLESHNVNGDGTVAAVFPILTGHHNRELEDWRRRKGNNKYVDEKLFLFHLLKKHGYRTAFYEETPETGTLQMNFNGFERQPADHYLWSFFVEEAKSKRQRYCLGDQPGYRVLLNLTKQFFELQGKKFCMTMINEISHDDFNMIAAADDDLVSFLKTFKSDKRLEDTLLFVMGDHGFKIGLFRNTYQGKIEERLPFMSIVLPEKLKRKKPNALMNLRANKDVLTTHFDVHTTLLDALGLKGHRNSYRVPGSGAERGLSFLEPIPKMRTCAEAGVMPYWCACAKWHNVTFTHPIYKKAAEALARYIDSITEEKRSKCAKRNLLAIEWVMSQSPSEQMFASKPYKNVIDRFIEIIYQSKHVRAASEYYQAKIVMSPGRAVFEGLMQYIVKDDFFVISEGDISRVNAYGDEPKCVISTHPHLRKYCYCII